jgi:hypothetical protein
MRMHNLNLLAILVAAIATMPIGVFPTAVRQSLDARNGAFILALFLHHMNAHNFEYGLLIGSHVWLGFVATVQLTGALFMKQSMKLLANNTGYQLACYLGMSAILTLWR